MTRAKLSTPSMPEASEKLARLVVNASSSNARRLQRGEGLKSGIGSLRCALKSPTAVANRERTPVAVRPSDCLLQGRKSEELVNASRHLPSRGRRHRRRDRTIGRTQATRGGPRCARKVEILRFDQRSVGSYSQTTRPTRANARRGRTRRALLAAAKHADMHDSPHQLARAGPSRQAPHRASVGLSYNVTHGTSARD